MTIRALIQLIHRAQKDSGGFFTFRSTVVAVLANLHNHASLKIRIEAVKGLRALSAREVMQFLRDPRPEVRRFVIKEANELFIVLSKRRGEKKERRGNRKEKQYSLNFIFENCKNE